MQGDTIKTRVDPRLTPDVYGYRVKCIRIWGQLRTDVRTDIGSEGTLQVDSIKTRVERAYGFSACSQFQLAPQHHGGGGGKYGGGGGGGDGWGGDGGGGKHGGGKGGGGGGGGGKGGGGGGYGK